MAGLREGRWDQPRDTVEDRGWELVKRVVDGVAVACRVPECRYCASVAARHRVLDLVEAAA